MHLRKKNNWYKRLHRNAKYQLVIPLKRSKHPPGYTARGVALGLGLAMTPSIGMHLVIIPALWLVLHKLLRWEFSLLACVAWSALANILTMVPLYYLLYLTGHIMLGDTPAIAGFDQFAKVIGSLHGHADLGFWENTRLWLVNLFQGLGKPMLIGSIPWAASLGWLGYRLTYEYTVRHREGRARRMVETTLRRRLPHASPPPRHHRPADGH
jgi:uncharacterized protein (DUF2062 family)